MLFWYPHCQGSRYGWLPPMVICVQLGSSLSSQLHILPWYGIFPSSCVTECCCSRCKRMCWYRQHVWSSGPSLSQWLGRDSQAHWSTRFFMSSYTKGHVGVGDALAYCRLEGQELTGPTGCPHAKEQSKEQQSWMSQLLSCDGWHRDPQTPLLQEQCVRIWL
jgi:hypothetical protein